MPCQLIRSVILDRYEQNSILRDRSLHHKKDTVPVITGRFPIPVVAAGSEHDDTGDQINASRSKRIGGAERYALSLDVR